MAQSVARSGTDMNPLSGPLCFLKSSLHTGAVRFVAFDLQHGTVGMSNLQQLASEVRSAGCQPFARVLHNDLAHIGQTLDRGITGIIAPLINTARDAERLVKFCKYPTPENPQGQRSFGPLVAGVSTDPSKANQSVVVMAMIETKAGLDNVEDICAVPGLDGVFVGPYDLSLSNGWDPDPCAKTQRMQDALERIRKAAELAQNPLVGAHCSDAAMLERLGSKEGGYNFLTAGTDHGAAVSGLEAFVSAVPR